VVTVLSLVLLGSLDPGVPMSATVTMERPVTVLTGSVSASLAMLVTDVKTTVPRVTLVRTVTKLVSVSQRTISAILLEDVSVSLDTGVKIVRLLSPAWLYTQSQLWKMAVTPVMFLEEFSPSLSFSLSCLFSFSSTEGDLKN